MYEEGHTCGPACSRMHAQSVRTRVRTHTQKSYDFWPEIPVQTKHSQKDTVIVGKLISTAPFLRTYSPHVSLDAIENLCRNVDLQLVPA